MDKKRFRCTRASLALPGLLLSLLLLSGCAVSLAMPDRQPALELADAKPGYALVYISRPRHGFAGDVWPEIFFNGANVVPLKNGTFTYVHARPGPYTVTAKKGQWYSGRWGETIDIWLDANETHFLSLDVLDRSSEASGDRRWNLLQREEALSRLRRQRYLQPNTDTL